MTGTDNGKTPSGVMKEPTRIGTDTANRELTDAEREAMKKVQFLEGGDSFGECVRQQ